jgi:carboxymethylenebutenolidase
MCFEVDARPPELPADLVVPRLAGAAAAERLELESADGTRFAAALAAVDGPAEPGVIVLPDVRGLYRFYIELAERFAAAGRSAIAIDYFGRSAGVEERAEDFEYMPHVMATTVENVGLEIAAARDALRERTGARSVVTVGFCFGGAQSFVAASRPELDLAGAIGFYGTLDPARIDPALGERFPVPLRHVDATRCPVLGLFGGDDAFIPAEDITAFDEALDETGVEHEIITYEGAPHSFFDREAADHAEASADAWRRIMGFLDQVAAQPVG